MDLSNLPLNAATKPGDMRITNLSAAILKDQPAIGSIASLVGKRPDLTTEYWIQTAGLVEWELNEHQLRLLEDHRLRVTFQFQTLDANKNPQLQFFVIEEHPSGKYVDIDRRSIRTRILAKVPKSMFMPGDSACRCRRR